MSRAERVDFTKLLATGATLGLAGLGVMYGGVMVASIGAYYLHVARCYRLARLPA